MPVEERASLFRFRCRVGGRIAVLVGSFAHFAIPLAAFAQAETLVGDAGVEMPDAAAPQDGDDDGGVVAVEPSSEVVEVITRGDSRAQQLRESAQAVKVIETASAQSHTADVATLLARTEGVAIQRTGGTGSDARLSLHGLSGDQIRLFMDGIPLELAGFGLGVSTLPLSWIDRVDVYRGVVPIEYSIDALGGAVDFVSSQNYKRSRLAASLTSGAFDTYAATANGHYYDEATHLVARAGTFADYSKNDYVVTADVADEEGGLSPTQVRRFHDRYRAFGAVAETGYVWRPWARQLLLRLYGTHFDQDVQHNTNMTVPYGEVTSAQTALGASLRYELRNIAGSPLDLTTVAAYSHRTLDFEDDSNWVYDWFGRRIFERPEGAGEIEAFASDLTQWEHRAFARLTLAWDIAREHTLRWVVAPDLTARTGRERLRVIPERIDPLSTKREVWKIANGLDYEFRGVDWGTEAHVFAKHYLYEPTTDQVLVFDNSVERIEKSLHRFGAGTALRQRLFDGLVVKASYEYASRLPRSDELFGDGVLVFPNLDLLPESGHNANLGARFDHDQEEYGALACEATAFLRYTENMIFELLSRDRVHSIFQNVAEVHTLGVDGIASWVSPRRFLSVQQNVTFQDQRNESEEGRFSPLRGERLANRPWFFANTFAELRFAHAGADNAALSIAYYLHYVHAFYAGSENATGDDSARRIPDQLTHDLSIGYTVEGPLKLAFAIDLVNIGDARVYEVLGVQKPGRSAFFKVSVQWEPSLTQKGRN